MRTTAPARRNRSRFSRWMSDSGVSRGNDHELPSLLDRDGGGAVDQVRHRAGGDRPRRAHRARADDVRVHLRRTARIRARASRSARARSRRHGRRRSGAAPRPGRGRDRRRARWRRPRAPADEAQRPTSTSAATSASRRRAAYGAPEAPVIPRKMFISPAPGALAPAAAAALGALRLFEEGARAAGTARP